MQPSKDMYLFSLMILMLVAGSCNVLLKDFMVTNEAPTSPTDLTTSPFHQPILWSLLMKCGMALCLPCYLYQSNFERPKAPIYVFVFSCALGFVTDVLINMAYCAIAGSAIQMLRGGKVMLTALLSVMILKRQLSRAQIIGCSIVISGIVLVGMSTGTATPEDSGMANTSPHPLGNLPWKAIGYCLAGEMTQAVLWVYQESILKTYDIAPLQLVGMEGIIGVVIGSAAVAAAHPLGIENFWVSMHQLSHSMPLLASVICMLVSMALFNYAGVGVTKRGSAVHRSIIDVSRSVVIWGIELMVGWHTFYLSQAIGFVTLASGALIYNRIVVVPMFETKDGEEIPILAKKAGV